MLRAPFSRPRPPFSSYTHDIDVEDAGNIGCTSPEPKSGVKSRWMGGDFLENHLKVENRGSKSRTSFFFHRWKTTDLPAREGGPHPPSLALGHLSYSEGIIRSTTIPLRASDSDSSSRSGILLSPTLLGFLKNDHFCHFVHFDAVFSSKSSLRAPYGQWWCS